MDSYISELPEATQESIVIENYENFCQGVKTLKTAGTIFKISNDS
jgi:hypothetical protein